MVYEVGMAESVGIAEATSYLLSLFGQQTLYLTCVLFGDLSWDMAIPTSVYFIMFLIFYSFSFCCVTFLQKAAG